MFSGKSAVSDILREFNGINVPNYLVEFDLLRMPGGLIDLKNAVDDWSPIRTYAAVKSFDKLVNLLALTPRFPQKLYKTGYGYEKRYPNIIHLKNEFISSIIAVKWETPWPYDDIYDGAYETFSRKLLSKFNIDKSRTYYLVDKIQFISAARNFVQTLIAESFDESVASSEFFVTHNALEPFSPQNNLTLLGENALSVVVDRDPRDIYATAIATHPGFNDNLKLFRRVAGAHDVDVFIKRYKIYRSNINLTSNKVLRLNLRDIISNYEDELDRLCRFLEIDSSQHIKKREYFDPYKSISNIDLWKRSEFKSYASDFEKIFDCCKDA